MLSYAGSELIAIYKIIAYTGSQADCNIAISSCNIISYTGFRLDYDIAI